MSRKIFLSLMAADLLNLKHEIQRFDAHCDGYHLDVMDFHFVPNLSFGIDTINSIAQATRKQLNIHLMVNNPEKIFEQLELKPKSIVSFHVSTTQAPERLIKKIKHKECLPGLVLNPHVDVITIKPYASDLHQVLIMGVEPGFSGQPMLAQTVQIVQAAALLKKELRLPLTIAVDGGVSRETIASLARHGAKSFIVASAVFKSNDPLTALEELYDLLESD